MVEEQNKPTSSEVCMINIAFPVGNDEDALTIKKAISEALKNKPGVTMDFRIRSANRMPFPTP